jgi:GTP-binding protein
MPGEPKQDPLPIRSLEFLGGMATPDGWRPPGVLPEVAFWGRSNVGKSSLLNRLVRRKKLARVSNTPGRTREINFFNVNGDFILVDLPGYGYARVSKAAREGWRPLIEGYVTKSEHLRGVVLLLDSRRDPSSDDLLVLDWLAEVGVPVLVVATKSDKLGARALDERLTALTTMLSLDADAIVPVSSVTGAGRDELAAALVALTEQPSWRKANEDK